MAKYHTEPNLDNIIPHHSKGDLEMVEELLGLGIFEKSMLNFEEMKRMGRITHMVLGQFAVGAIIQSGEFMFAVDPKDFGVGLELRQHGLYGEQELSYLSQLIDHDSNVLIVGAHIGTLAIPLSRICSKIVAIEANPSSSKLLTLNLRINSIYNCEVLQVAATDKNGKLEFLVNTANSGGSKRKPQKKDFKYYYDDPQLIEVHGKRLDDLLEEREFELIIMDIEGSEFYAMAGMPNILKKCRKLVIEFVPHHIKDVAGISIRKFVSMFAAFDKMIIPSRQLEVRKKDFLFVLKHMYENSISDDGLIFIK